MSVQPIVTLAKFWSHSDFVMLCTWCFMVRTWLGNCININSTRTRQIERLLQNTNYFKKQKLYLIWLHLVGVVFVGTSVVILCTDAQLPFSTSVCILYLLNIKYALLSLIVLVFLWLLNSSSQADSYLNDCVTFINIPTTVGLFPPWKSLDQSKSIFSLKMYWFIYLNWIYVSNGD